MFTDITAARVFGFTLLTNLYVYTCNINVVLQVHLVIVYVNTAATGANTGVYLYRNGVELGNYTQGVYPSYSAAGLLFGPRYVACVFDSIRVTVRV